MKSFLQGALGGVVAVALLAFTNQTTPSRHFADALNQSARYVITSSGNVGNTGVPVPVATSLFSTGNIPTATSGDAGVESTPRIEYGVTTLSGATKVVPFLSTFGNAPVCVCSDDTAVAACDVVSVTATQLTLNGTGTDKVFYICVGGS